MQVATKNTIYVFDCIELEVRSVCNFLREMLQDRVIKLFHDFHEDTVALERPGGIGHANGPLET